MTKNLFYILYFLIGLQSFCQEIDFEKDVIYYTDLIKTDPSANNYYFRGYTK